jgi:hypothetical protein
MLKAHCGAYCVSTKRDGGHLTKELAGRIDHHGQTAPAIDG